MMSFVSEILHCNNNPLPLPPTQYAVWSNSKPNWTTIFDYFSSVHHLCFRWRANCRQDCKISIVQKSFSYIIIILTTSLVIRSIDRVYIVVKGHHICNSILRLLCILIVFGHGMETSVHLILTLVFVHIANMTSMSIASFIDMYWIGVYSCLSYTSKYGSSLTSTTLSCLM